MPRVPTYDSPQVATGGHVPQGQLTAPQMIDAQTVGEAIAAMQPRRQPRPEQPQVVQTLPQPTQAPAMPPRLSDAQRRAQQRAGAQALRSHAEQLAAARGPDIITAAAPLSSDDLTRIINNRTLPERARLQDVAPGG